MSVTSETRRQSYEEVLATLNNRQSAVYSNLKQWGDTGVTASELSLYMHEKGIFPTSDRNNVHPRLNELVAKGLVKVTGKRKCTVTNKTVAVYQVSGE